MRLSALGTGNTDRSLGTIFSWSNRSRDAGGQRQGSDPRSLRARRKPSIGGAEAPGGGGGEGQALGAAAAASPRRRRGTRVQAAAQESMRMPGQLSTVGQQQWDEGEGQQQPNGFEQAAEGAVAGGGGADAQLADSGREARVESSVPVYVMLPLDTVSEWATLCQLAT